MSKQKVFLGIDLGASSIKISIIDNAKNINSFKILTEISNSDTFLAYIDNKRYLGKNPNRNQNLFKDHIEVCVFGKGIINTIINK